MRFSSNTYLNVCEMRSGTNKIEDDEYRGDALPVMVKILVVAPALFAPPLRQACPSSNQ